MISGVINYSIQIKLNQSFQSNENTADPEPWGQQYLDPLNSLYFVKQCFGSGKKYYGSGSCLKSFHTALLRRIFNLLT